MAGIVRAQTDEEKRDFTSIYKKDPLIAFKEKMYKESTKANKKGLPFAEKACVDDFQNAIQSQVDLQLKKYGRVKEELKLPEIDFQEYCDLKNFKLVEEGETRDKYLSKIHKFPVMIKKKVYTFREYGNKYVVMEDADEALGRQMKKSVKHIK